MTFGELLTEVYRLLEDEGQFAWTNKAVARHCTDAIRRVSEATGADSQRGTMALVSGQSEYNLPVGIRRVNAIKILPLSATEPPDNPLLEVALDQLPVVAQSGDPLYYALNMTGGTSENQFVVNFHPTPARSAADSIIYDFEGEYTISSDNPATTPQKAVVIPFPSMFQTVILNYTAGALLNESDDPSDQAKGANLIGEAQSHIRGLAFYRSLSSMISLNRAFP